MTKREEKILETFYLLWKEGKMPSAGELSGQYKLDHPEWGAAINRLISHGYLEKVKDKEELKLTDLGKARAAESQARHQYLTEFLQITCGVGEEKAQENACRMEHVIDKEIMAGVREFLKYGDTCDRMVRTGTAASRSAVHRQINRCCRNGWKKPRGIFPVLQRTPRGIPKTGSICLRRQPQQLQQLQNAIANLQTVTNTTVDKSGLHTMLLAATSIAGRDHYTEATINKLKKVIKTAEAVYQKEDATQEEVDQQTSALAAAIIALEQKNTDGGGSQGDGNGDENGGGEKEGTLDIHQLKDGMYSITGTMVKIDKTSASMSNEAISHTIKLTVKDGTYFITLNFKGLSVGKQFGYLSELKYFTTGYSTDSYGAPSGKLKSVTVDSYQENKDGTRVSDSFGTDYPRQVTFPLIAEALKDGYVPLQVFVPIMDSISAGSGTQAVFLKLELGSLKAETDDEVFQDDDENQNQNQNPGGTSESNSNSLLNQSTPISGQGSTLKSASSLKKGTSLLPAAKTLSEGSGIADTSVGLTGTQEEPKTEVSNSGAVVTGTSQNSTKEDDATQAIPTVMSFLAAAAGVIYKVSSRRVFAR